MSRAPLAALRFLAGAALLAAGCHRGSSETTRSAITGAGGTGGHDAGPRAGADDGDDAGSVPLHCGQGSCDLQSSSGLGCPSGQGCVFGFLGMADQPSAQCEKAGTGQDGASCSSNPGFGDCAPGFGCTASADGSAEGECRRYCCAQDHRRGCPDGQICRIGITDRSGALSGVFLCSECSDCDLREPASCGEGRGCYAIGGRAGCNVCLPKGKLAVGHACSQNDECVPGSGCLSANGASRCVGFCDLEHGSGCATGMGCAIATGAELPDGVGVCAAR